LMRLFFNASPKFWLNRVVLQAVVVAEILAAVGVVVNPTEPHNNKRRPHNPKVDTVLHNEEEEVVDILAVVGVVAILGVVGVLEVGVVTEPHNHRRRPHNPKADMVLHNSEVEGDKLSLGKLWLHDSSAASQNKVSLKGVDRAVVMERLRPQPHNLLEEDTNRLNSKMCKFENLLSQLVPDAFYSASLSALYYYTEIT